MQNIDYDRIRNDVLAYKEAKGISMTKLGEVLGSKSETIQGKIALAKKILTEKETPITLQQIEALAAFMDREPEQLLFGGDVTITNHGDHNQNIVQNGQNNHVNHATPTSNSKLSAEDFSDLEAFLGLDPEKRHHLIELLKQQ